MIVRYVPPATTSAEMTPCQCCTKRHNRLTTASITCKSLPTAPKSSRHHMKRIALIGDYNDHVVAHRAIPMALRMAVELLQVDIRWDWLPSGALDLPIDQHLRDYAAVWCVPGSPYKNTRGVIESIRFARTHSLPFLGTCGGFQHAIMEYAESIWGIDAMHAELDPDAIDQVIAPLLCSLIEVTDQLNFVAGSRLQKI